MTVKKPTARAFPKYASVVLDTGISKTLDYGVPQELLSVTMPGARVEVPLRGRKEKGTIFELKERPAFHPVRGIYGVVSDGDVVTPDLFELAQWMAKYYCCSLQKVLKVMLPASVRRETKAKEQKYVMRGKTREQLRELVIEIREKYPAQAEVLEVMLQVHKGILLTELLEETGGSRSPVTSLEKKGALKVDVVRIDRSPLTNAEYFKTTPKKLMHEQQVAYDAISDSMDEHRFETHLLYGITGSGKTEVYLQAIAKALELGRGTIMLVPEIALTAQTIERFRSRFDDNIAVLHHRLSHGERNDEWQRIRRGDARIVVGARSALFSPVQNLGLVIVDEEHDSSYKASEEMPCYSARDVAVMRGKLSKSAVVLGTATPSLESYYNALNGKYNLLTLNERADSATLAKVNIVDMNEEFKRQGGYTNFSDALLNGIKERVELGEQTLLFLNRRGYHTTLLCKGCQEGIQCAHCSVALTYHQERNSLSCHLCGFAVAPPPKQCPKCGCDETMKFRGVGTEQVERSLHAVLPEIRTLRADADTTRHKGSHQRILRDFRAGKADVLIGTQMITKGLHFPQVTLVGILHAEQGIGIPDFRSSETVFQLITQVAGRAGRAQLAGEVVVQTRIPSNTTIQHACKQDFKGFYDEEIAVRELFGYPPFARFAKVRFSGEQPTLVTQTAERFREVMARQLAGRFAVHPITPAGYAKIKDRYFFQFLVRGTAMSAFSEAIELALQTVMLPKGVRLLVDVDPLSTYF